MVTKRFSIKKLQDWLLNTANEMVQGTSLQDGTCYYYNVSSWLCVVMCWSEYDDIEYDKYAIAMKSSGVRKDFPDGEEYEHAYELEVSLRIREPISEWGNLPSDFKYAIADEGGLTFSNSDFEDDMKAKAHYLSKERTTLLKRHRD